MNKIVQEKNDLINYYNINKTINEYNININNINYNINNINSINNKKEKDEEKY